MNAISREEFNARIETIETRMDTRVNEVSAKIDAFLVAQAERDKAQLERDKRYDSIATQMQDTARRAEDAARQGATVKANVWAATVVQLVGIVAIVVGACYANQANTYVAIQTTLAAIQAGKEFRPPSPFDFSLPESPE
ncbi:Uncharacterised protein [Pseudomonas fluorescens]|uniref:Uncharacterized protein n=1 Tax=Pseudomonas fluorescens TaxID=294 RepID=A0A448DU45_PSEFL|nr:hypothetical protein [Pseudomonas fluorescens]VEF10345.1 Uncharacterised protein [Pseudomonas fluorescens]